MAVGDLLTQIGTVTADGSSATLSFTDVPATESQSFIIRGVCSVADSSSTDLRMRFNSDSNTNYYTQTLRSYAGGASTVSMAFANYMALGSVPGTSVNVGLARAFFYIDLYNLSANGTGSDESPGNPGFWCQSSGIQNQNSDTEVAFYGGSYAYSLGAPTGTDVTTISLHLGAGTDNFSSASRFTLYQRPTS
jgi:hypothetical protein|tara:strand:- start:783 stop:1358 length:576 start_codon:yes stop_codon:yes gene_type:complete